MSERKRQDWFGLPITLGCVLLSAVASCNSDDTEEGACAGFPPTDIVLWSITSTTAPSLRFSNSRWSVTEDGAYYYGVSIHPGDDSLGMLVYLKQDAVWPPQRHWEVGSEEVGVWYFDGEDTWVASSGTVDIEPYNITPEPSSDSPSSPSEAVDPSDPNLCPGQDSGLSLTLDVGLTRGEAERSLKATVRRWVYMSCDYGTSLSKGEVLAGASSGAIELVHTVWASNDLDYGGKNTEICAPIHACVNLFDFGVDGDCSF